MLRRILGTIIIALSFCLIIPTESFAIECCAGGLYFSTGNNTCRPKNRFGQFSEAGQVNILCDATEICDYFNPPAAFDSLEIDHPEWQYYANAQCVKRKTLSPAGASIPAAGGRRCTDTQISTAIGCIEYGNPASFASQFIRYGVGIGSGVAFLLIIFGTYKMISSQGIPEGINQGKEIITSAIIGLVFIILTVTMIQIIGFDILGLGGLGLGTR